MKSNQFAKTLIFLCLVILTGCGTQALPTPIPSPTIEEVSVVSETDEPIATETPTPEPTFTPSPSPEASPEPTATNTLVPTVTTTSTPSPTPEPVAKIDETITGLINVRAGPGTDYPTIAQLEATGQELPVTGRNEDSSWWQISLTDTKSSNSVGWIFGNLVLLSGNDKSIPIAEIPPLPTATPEPVAVTETKTESETENSNSESEPSTAEQLADELRCGKDFCVTYQEMVPIWENGGCVGNHSIYITVLKGLPPGEPMDGVVIGDTFNNVEVASGDHGPGRTEITLWSNSMTLIAKRNIDDTPYTSEESFNFTSLDELIPAEVLAASGYCEGRVDVCEYARNHNSVCRGHYSWRVTFHKFD